MQLPKKMESKTFSSPPSAEHLGIAKKMQDVQKCKYFLI